MNNVTPIDTGKDMEMVNVASLEGGSNNQQLCDIIAKKTKTYDPEAGQDGEAEFDTTEKIGWWGMVARERSTTDLIKFILGLIAATGIGAALPAFCLIFGEMIDGVAGVEADDDSGDGFNALQKQSFIMGYIGLGLFFIGMTQVSMLTQFGESITFKTQVNYFKQALEQDAYFYEKQNPTEMASKITKEMSALKKGTSNKVGSAQMALASFVLGFGFSFYWGWLMNVILLAFVPVMIILGVMMGAALQSGLTESLKAYSQSAGYAEQALQAIKIVHTYGQEKLEESNYKKYLARGEVIAAKTNIKAAFGFAGVMSGFLCFYAYSFYFGGYLRWNDIKNYDGREYSGGVIVTIMFSTVFGAATAGSMAPHVKAIAESQIAGKLAYDTIDHVPKIKANEVGTKVLQRQEIKGGYEFKNVDFVYPSRPDQKILKNFSCVFEEGKTTALVGPSGSGKSTIIQLLERFYDVSGGELLLDGTNIKTLNLRSMRQLIGYVGQEPVLFNASIKENMLFAKPDATDDEITQALKDANAWDFIQKKMGSTGINTQVGGSGGQLSGGQKQRIAIARAFLKKPKVLLLDEATSALDKMNEKAIQDAIDNYKKQIGNITTIVIAHRLTTIRDADKIVVLKNGELVEMGNHEALLQQYPDGVYAGFCKKQESANAGTQEETATRPKEDEDETVVAKVDPKEAMMKEKADKTDQLYKEELDKMEEENKKISGYTKLEVYNKPVYLIVIATFGAILNGSAQPALGVVFAKMVGLLSIPKEYQTLMYGEDYLQQEVTKLALFMVILAVCNGIAIVFQKYSFGYLGNKVTQKVREALYVNILQKNIGWFDDRDNGPSVLTSILSADAAAINGVGGESIGPTAESAFGMIIGIAVGFYFSPLQAVVCLVVSPVMVIGASVDMAMIQAEGESNQDEKKESDLLCGDCIVNFKTVQSFGHEEQLVKKYKELLTPGHKAAMTKAIKSGAAFGCSQLSQYIVFGVMFFFGGLIIKNSVDEETGEVKTSAEDVFIALFAIMFGANAAGNAASFGPDMEKANTAATKIFKVIEVPSTINAVEMDEKNEKKRIDIEKVRGEIEFKDVWFRYPTRKEDFVMKGLNIKINPNEQVALVGESGCGKSTFVNLLMRFYDVDSGEILLDGVNIKDYNLHDLRNVISLVMQEPIIFNYSILENVLYGKSDASNDEIYNATTIANANEFIEGNGMINQTKDEDLTAAELVKKMDDLKTDLVAVIGKTKFDEEMETLKKMVEQDKNKGEFVAITGDVDTRPENLRSKSLHEGFNTICGLKGNKLSGGQKQRVAIARTIIRAPKILLLDEATSALDEDSQKKVQGALENAMKGRTTIIIAHRMSTIEKCDKVFVLETGKVIEEGGFEELKNKDGGFFSNLAQGKQK